MKIKATVELTMEVPDETIIKSFYDKTSANDFKVLKQDIVNDLKDSDWNKVNILEFSVEDVNPSKFKVNKPIK